MTFTAAEIMAVKLALAGKESAIERGLSMTGGRTRYPQEQIARDTSQAEHLRSVVAKMESGAAEGLE